MKFEKPEGIAFSEEEVMSLDVTKIKDVSILIIERLCGKLLANNILKDRDIDILREYLKIINSNDMSYNQFNELLLLLNQHKISKGFYNFFFGAKIISLQDINKGIIKFRGFALLCFGNIRYAYKTLNEKKYEEIEKLLSPFSRKSKEIHDYFNNREECKIKINEINSKQTWLNGYIAIEKFKKETKEINRIIDEGKTSNFTYDDLDKILELIETLQKEYKTVVKKALINTDKYLAWNFMDVYIATSMRKRWEFEDVSQFIKDVFSSSKLQNLKLRFFDPTQSQCSNRFDKGLVESLILKRSLCTLYMVQEGDTFGKDSELAITLAQGKPVIAYVPQIDIKKRIRKLRKYPLEYFQTMFYKFKAEEFIDKDEIKEILLTINNDYYKEIYYSFLKKIQTYRKSQPFTLYEDKDEVFKNKDINQFNLMCMILATLEKKYFDKRAKTLKEIHPLSLQVNLNSGVANGVLVVREIEKCQNLLYSLLTNTSRFSIRYFQEESKDNLGKSSYSLLEEQITDCPFRIETRYNKLTNSYWNSYFGL